MVRAPANILFVHRNFPGQFLHVLRHLAGEKRYRVVFISEATSNRMSGVHQVAYAYRPVSSRTHGDAQDFEDGMRRAAAVAEVAAGLREAGFTPDLIIGHESWGETLNLPDIWPHAPIVGFREYFYHLNGADVGCDPEFPVSPVQHARIRAKNAIGLLGLQTGAPGLSPTLWQRSLYPAWSQPGITVVPDGVDTALCRPDPGARDRPFVLEQITVAPGERLLTFVARELEPYRGFHIFMRALPAILRARGDVRVICLGGDGIAYGLPPGQGTWRQALSAELGDGIDPLRVQFAGKVPYAAFLRLIQRSDVHVYPSYPFIVSWSLREAMACGCAVVAADTEPAREFLEDGATGILVPPLDPAQLADAVLALLEDDARRMALSGRARTLATGSMNVQGHLAAMLGLMQETLDARP